MREILFRGKRVDTGEWIEGSLFKAGVESKTYCSIFGDNLKFTASGMKVLSHAIVDPETIGQYTGLTDKNGTRIFEGDIVHWKKVPYFVKWDSQKAEFVFAYDIDANYFVAGFNEYATSKFCKVIGNIYDNPELLKGE